MVVGRGRSSLPERARDGIGMVHQHFTSMPRYGGGENIELAGKTAGRTGGWEGTAYPAGDGGIVDRARVEYSR